LAGGTIVGRLLLSVDPSVPLEAASKRYVDNRAPLGGPYLPLAGGSMQGGLTLAGDPLMPLHAVPLRYLQANYAPVGVYVLKNGDTMTGPLTLPADPLADMQAATKQYVDHKSGAGLSEAPMTGLTYGRQSAAWNQVIAANNDIVDGGNF
jgi:hypothetical protein